MATISSSSIQDQALITALPFELLDIIKNKNPEIQTQNLALACKDLYHWRCHYIVADSTRASKYVQKLLEHCSAEEMKRSLSWFHNQLPCKLPIHLAYTMKQPLSPEKLDIIKTNFPNVQSVHTAPAFRVKQSSLQVVAAAITNFAFGIVLWIIILACLPVVAVHRVVARLGRFGQLHALDPQLFINKALNKISEVRNNILVRLGTRGKDETLEEIASSFPEIKKIEMDLDEQFDYHYGIWGAPKVPPLPKLQTLKLTGNSTLLKQRYDFSEYSSVTTLQLGIKCHYRFNDESMQMRFSSRAVSLTLSSELVSMLPIGTLLRKHPQVQSLSLIASRIDDDRNADAVRNIEKLYIECEEFYLNHHPTGGIYFPQLKQLSLYVTSSSLGVTLTSGDFEVYHLIQYIPPNTLLHLSIRVYCRLSDRTIAEIFKRFQDLQTFTYCVPQKIAQPASHPNLRMRKLTEAEMIAYFQKEHHLPER